MKAGLGLWKHITVTLVTSGPDKAVNSYMTNPCVSHRYVSAGEQGSSMQPLSIGSCGSHFGGIHKATPSSKRKAGYWEEMTLTSLQSFQTVKCVHTCWMVRSMCACVDWQPTKSPPTEVHAYHQDCSPLRSPHSLSSGLLPGDLHPRRERGCCDSHVHSVDLPRSVAGDLAQAQSGRCQVRPAREEMQAKLEFRCGGKG